MRWIFLGIAILSEVTATTALKYSDGFKNIIPSIVVVLGYGVCFYFLSLAIKQIPIGITYAIWSGVGITLITLLGFFVFKQKIDIPAIIGLSFIIVGIVVIKLFSENVSQ